MFKIILMLMVGLQILSVRASAQHVVEWVASYMLSHPIEPVELYTITGVQRTNQIDDSMHPTREFSFFIDELTFVSSMAIISGPELLEIIYDRTMDRCGLSCLTMRMYYIKHQSQNRNIFDA